MKTSLFSFLPTSWLVAGGFGLLLALGAAGGVGAWKGYSAGYAKAESEGKRALLFERLERAAENVQRALAVAEAERGAREKTEAAVAEAGRLEKELIEYRSRLEAQEIDFRRRIADAAQSTAGTCAGLNDDWVRLYNEYLGASGTSSRGSVPAAGHSGNAQGPSGPGSGAGAGIPRAKPLKLATPADILEHAKDYGKRSRWMEKQLNGWIDLSQQWEQ